MGKKILRWALFSLVFGGGAMALAGDWTSPILWAYLTGVSAVFLYALLSLDSDLAKERFYPPTPGADASALRWIRLTALAAVIISPLDGGRFHWSPPIADRVRYVAVLGSIVAYLLCFYAMMVNRFFSAVVRIQTDRGHEVVDFGPYAIVRHPGYAGMIVGVPLMGIAFGSWIGFAIASIYSLLILRRVAFEDRFLQEHLPGYTEYTARVRSRLVPGIW